MFKTIKIFWKYYIEKILVSMKQLKNYELTEKDINLILRLNYRGWKNKEIARAFNISESEVKYVLENK